MREAQKKIGPRTFSTSIRRGMLRIAAVGLVTWPTAPTAAETVMVSESPAFKIRVEEAGAYRVAFEDLDLGDLHLPSSGIGLESGGEPVPVWVNDGGDGVFGPGNWLEFVGQHLSGESTFYDESTRFNVYFLRFDHPQPARLTAADAGSANAKAPIVGLRARHHLEQDLVRLRLTGGTEELWYWARLSHLADEPHVEILDLTDLDRRPGQTIDLRIHFRGWSTPAFKADPEAGDHRVDVAINGTPITSAEWNGTEDFLLEIDDLPTESLNAGENRLELQVPSRPLGKNEQPLVDVLVLNWFEVDLPLAGRIADWQERVTLSNRDLAGRELSGHELRQIRLTSDHGRELLLFGNGGSRISVEAQGEADRGEALVVLPDEETAWMVTAADRLRSPETIVRDRPSQLADSNNQADYVMVAHHSLLEATEKLAELHRDRGLAVELVDIENVYDEFGHGIERPHALRAFLDHAYHNWQPPRLRFVLLVGDASWDVKNELVQEGGYPALSFRRTDAKSFNRIPSTPYSEEAHLNRRGLIPTWTQSESQGQAASDNYFVAVDGDDNLPDMAIGRLPVVEPAEVSAIVDKIIRYVTEPRVGPWRRNALFIANESRSFQNQSDNVAQSISADGFLPSRVYPASNETSNEQHSRRLIEAFDDGQLMVHFYGHGGRYIWRTGPPDLKKNHDLFTLDHLDQLQPNDRLPVVLSMTCYSAPFDHPNADSIGEKLLRLGDRGAIAVLAASWRNSPSANWGKITMEELTTPGRTIGEAIQLAKQRLKHKSFVETYNLLGDPAIPIALPEAEIAVEVAVTDDGPWSVRGTIDLEDFDGRMMVELADASGYVHESVDLEPQGTSFAVEFPPTPQARRILVYAWDDDQQRDAYGVRELTKDELTQARETPEAASARSK